MSSNRSSQSQVITCKAAVCWGMGEAVKLEEIQVEAPQASEVRVKMLYASFCHTDLLFIRGYPFPAFPRVLGHEGVGVVESIGEDVGGIKEGDIVIPTYVAECRKCENCVSQNTNLCLTHPLDFSGLINGSSRMSIRGQKLYHSFTCSTWSEYMVLNVNFVVKLEDHDTVTLPHASFLSCGFSTGFGATWKEAQVHEGSTVAVFGLGAVGLGAIEGSRMRGAARIIGVDKNVGKKQKGEAFGMTDFINPDSAPSVSQLIKDLTDGKGVDYCFECTGFTPLISEALESTKLGKGKVIVFGASTDKHMQVNSLTLLCGRTLKGTIFGGLKPITDLPLLLHKFNKKEIRLDQLLTHRVSLLEIDRAFQLVKHPDCVKVLITF